MADGDPVPKGGGSYHIGAPYTVAGRTYYPQDNPNYQATGLASWYGDDFHGRLTANREVFDHNGISAAHPTMPLPSYARVTNLSNGRSLIVRVNDRGPYHGNRIIDVSTRAADLLGFRTSGTAWVKVEYVGRAPLEGSDDRLLAATFRQDEPAPAPGTVKLAATRIAPVGSTASILRNTHYASVSASDADTASTRPMSLRRRAAWTRRHRSIPQRPRALLERNRSGIKLIGALTFRWSMIFPENRIPLFRIML